jgi:hypothetical protein
MIRIDDHPSRPPCWDASVKDNAGSIAVLSIDDQAGARRIDVSKSPTNTRRARMVYPTLTMILTRCCKVV